MTRPRLLVAMAADGSRPWVIENVSGAVRISGALVLCGTEFGLGARAKDGTFRHLRRHRRFWSNVDLWGAGGCHCGLSQAIPPAYSEHLATFLLDAIGA